MSYIAPNSEKLESDTLFANRECARLPQAKANLPPTKEWKQGTKVQGNKNIKRGTAIANFVNTAIHLSQDEKGILVIDQWKDRGKVGKEL